MKDDDNGRSLTTQTTTTALQKSDLSRAGEAANAAAADYLFADYRQRRAKKTIKTQTAALQLWVQYLVEVGAAGELLAEASAWALVYFDEEAVAEMATYAASQPCSLPIIVGAHYCQHLPAAWPARSRIGCFW